VTGHPLFDEKIGGSFHFALGAAYPESGGTNRSAIHWDLVCDLRDGGSVEIDGSLINQNGRFLLPHWPGNR
jgi:aminopeptidase